jgi:small subunit ribosomal protein S9
MPTKKTTTKKAAPKTAAHPKKPAVVKPGKFFEGVGRRKTSLARVRFFASGDKDISINEKSLKDYFPTVEMQEIITSPLQKSDSVSSYKISAKVKGGGIHSQAEAVRHGIARALILFDPSLRVKLRGLGLLTRDSRMRERKKFGLKRARRAPQWRKR